jgi:hypothetical protein
MKNKLYKSTNKNKNTILIVAKNENEAIEISLILGFAKDQKNLKIEDFTEIYLTKDRQEKGLKFDDLASGQFLQKIENNISSWVTYMPAKRPIIMS